MARLEDSIPLGAGGVVTIADIDDIGIADAASKIHLQAFSGYLNARLGVGYARALIDWFAQQGDAIALAAMDGNHQVIGYAIGAPVTINHKLRGDLFWITARSIVLRPWLILDKRLWKVGYARLAKKNDAGNISHEQDLPKPTMSLFGIGVEPPHRRKGVGQQLLLAFKVE